MFKVGESIKDKRGNLGVIREIEGNAYWVSYSRDMSDTRTTLRFASDFVPLTNGDKLSSCKTNEERAELLKDYYFSMGYRTYVNNATAGWLNSKFKEVEE